MFTYTSYLETVKENNSQKLAQHSVEKHITNPVNKNIRSNKSDNKYSNNK